MAKNKHIRQSERIALAHRHQLESCDTLLREVSEHRQDLAAETHRQSTQLDEIDRLMESLFADAGLDRPDEAALAEVNIASHLQLSEAEKVEIERNLPTFSVDLAIPAAVSDWPKYLAGVDAYLAKHKIDQDQDPMEQLLSPQQVAEVVRQFDKNYNPSPWDKWDYSVVGLTVLIGSLLDFFLVSMPPGSKFKGIEYSGSPLTKWMNDQSTTILSGEGNTVQRKLGELSKSAEKFAKVSYDISNNGQILDGPKIDGLRPALHRIMNPGHDPILGFIFGIIDVLNGKCTLIDRQGRWNVITPEMRNNKVASINGPIDAIVIVAVHLFSDIFTKQGLPAPFTTVLQGINVDTGITVGEGGKPLQLPNLIRHMYAQGYDLRHFVTMSIVPMVAEMMIRTYHAVRTYQGGHQAQAKMPSKLKLANMLTVTHALLASSNVLKVGLSGWNPMAINYSQFLMLGKQAISTLKLAKERRDTIERDLANGWETLLKEEMAKVPQLK